MRDTFYAIVLSPLIHSKQTWISQEGGRIQRICAKAAAFEPRDFEIHGIEPDAFVPARAQTLEEWYDRLRPLIEPTSERLSPPFTQKGSEPRPFRASH